MLKEYLKEKDISIYKLAMDSNVPYTTLNELANGKKKIEDCKIKTIESIASSLNLSIESFLELLEKKEEKISSSWNDKRNYIYTFPVVYNNKNYDVSRIHPLKQKKISDLYYALKEYSFIKKVIVFGSSTTIRCNKDSDIDLAIEMDKDYYNLDNKNMISEKVQEVTNYNSDVLWINNEKEGTQILENINKGVVIYEQTSSKS